MSNQDLETIIVMDASSGEVFILPYNSNIYDDYEQFYAELGFKESNCSCMIVRTMDFNIQFYKET